jgi:hypothetical protein
VDELRKRPAGTVDLDEPGPAVSRARGESADAPTKLFIVSRGHPELVEQLRAVLADTEAVVIEDRRRSPRDPDSPSDRFDLRRRVLGEPAPDA